MNEYELLEEVENLYIDQLYGTEHLERFIFEKGLEIETIEEFHVGFARGDNSLVKLLTPYPEKLAIAQELGLIIPSGDGLIDFFRNRIMFPLWDEEGRCVGFDSRSVIENYLPKYMSSKRSHIFNRNEIIYGYHLAKKASKYHDSITICEGIIDVLKLTQDEGRNCVGILASGLCLNDVNKIAKLGNIHPDSCEVPIVKIHSDQRYSLYFLLGGLEFEIQPTFMDQETSLKVCEYFEKFDVRVISKPEGKREILPLFSTDQYEIPIVWEITKDTYVRINFDVDTIREPEERKRHDVLLFSGLLEKAVFDGAKRYYPYKFHEKKIYRPIKNGEIWTRYSLRGDEEGKSRYIEITTFTFEDI